MFDSSGKVRDVRHQKHSRPSECGRNASTYYQSTQVLRKNPDIIFIPIPIGLIIYLIFRLLVPSPEPPPCSEADTLNSGYRYLVKGDYDKARIEFYRVILSNPDC